MILMHLDDNVSLNNNLCTLPKTIFFDSRSLRLLVAFQSCHEHLSLHQSIQVSEWIRINKLI